MPNDNRDSDQLLTKLQEPFPREAVQRRKGGGDRWFDYVATHTVIRRLNHTARDWSFSIKSMDLRGDVWIVVGELTIPGLGTRAGIGVQRMNEKQQATSEDLIKGSASDALKNAARLFGVALDLYGPDYEEVDDRPQSPMRNDAGQIEISRAKSVRQAVEAAPVDPASITMRQTPPSDAREFWSWAREQGLGTMPHIVAFLGLGDDDTSGRRLSELYRLIEAKVTASRKKLDPWAGQTVPS